MININFYLEQYRTSFTHLRKNPILLVPDMLWSVIVFLGGYGTLTATGLLPLVKGLKSELPEDAAASVITFLVSHWASLLAWAVFFFLAAFVVGAGITALKFVMIKEVITNRKPHLAPSFSSSQAYFWKIVWIRVLAFLLHAAAILAGLVVWGVLSMINTTFAGVVTLVFVPIAFVIIMVGLFFRYPFLFKKNLSAKEAVKASYLYFKANKFFVAKVIFITYLTLFVAKVIFNILTMLSGNAAPVMVVATLALLVTNLFTTIYLFQIFEKYKAKT